MPLLARRALLGAALASPLLARAAQGQEWPARPIRLIVSFAAGGAADTAARSFGAVMSQRLGQPIVVENRSGGNAVIAASAALQAPADGYTFLIDAANQVTNPILLRNLAFDYRTAFVPVTQLVTFVQTVAVKSDLPPRTIGEFIAYAKERPGQVSYGTPPTAGMAHLAGELLQQMAGIRLLHSPYRGGAESARDLAAGAIDAGVITTPSVRPAVEAGRARVLAVTALHRSRAFPEAPTLDESGFPGFNMNDWSGLFAPAGVPREIVLRMEEAAKEAARSPAVTERLLPTGMEIVGEGAAAMTGFLEELRATCERVIRAGNISI